MRLLKKGVNNLLKRKILIRLKIIIAIIYRGIDPNNKICIIKIKCKIIFLIINLF